MLWDFKLSGYGNDSQGTCFLNYIITAVTF